MTYINQLLALYKDKRIDQKVAYQLIDEYKRTHSKTVEGHSSSKIAVIGISCRMPLADNKEAFWNVLRAGRDCVRKFPSSRRKDIDPLIDRIPVEHFTGSEKYWEGGFLENVDTFDNEFFKILPAEAKVMDPQQRLFLEMAHEAVQDAGYTRKMLQGTQTGVFLGDVMNEYHKIIPSVTSSAVVGNISPFITSRVAHFLDLHGPVVNVSTTCSTSLVAVHYACQSLLIGECKMAITGAINLRLFPFALKDDPIDALGILSASGKCRAFDNQADGIVRGEGGAALLLKKYDDAVADKDHIYCVILGSSVNNDGKSSSVGAPNPIAQEKLLVDAWRKCDINPRTIDYFEAHGTGTHVGDPIEIHAITRAFAGFTKDKQFCGLGSVKSNLGHLTGGASGLASLLKVILALHHKEIPPSLNFNQPNDLIDFTSSPLYIVNRLEEWRKGDHQRRGAVSAFGFNGTNCHLVVEEAPHIESEEFPKDKPCLLLVSSETEDGLRKLLELYLIHFRSNVSKLDVQNVCYTLAIGRDHYKNRVAFVIDSIAKAIVAIEDLLREAAISKRIITKAFNPILENAASEFCNGQHPNFLQIFNDKNLRRIPLPTYVFKKERFWIESTELINDHREFVRGASHNTTTTIKRDEREELRSIFCKLTGMNSLSDTDSFFELGGDSLLGVQLINEIHRHFNRKLSFKDLFSNPSVHKMLPLLTSGEEQKFQPIPSAEKSLNYPLSYSQRRLWILHQMQDDPIAYNMYECYSFDGNLDMPAFKEALNLLTLQHQSLRTVISVCNGEPSQNILSALEFPLTVIEGSEDEIFEFIDDFKKVPFNLEKGPLAKAILAKSNTNNFIFFLLIHHIISDGASTKLLFDDLLKNYGAVRNQTLSRLAIPAIQYTDFCVWEKSAYAQKQMKKLEEFWLKKYSGTLPVCEIMGDKTRPVVFNFKGSRELFIIPDELLKAYNATALNRNVTLFMTLLSTIYVLIYRFSNQSDMIVGTPVSGRSHHDVREISGLFTNTLALKCHLAKEDTFFTLLEKVKSDVLESLEHQDYPFDHLVNALNILRDTSRSPLFNINVALQNFDVNVESKRMFQGITINRKELPHHSCKWDLEFEFVLQAEKGLVCYVEYYTEIYSQSFISNLFNCYLNLAQELLNNPNQALSHISVKPATCNIVNQEHFLRHSGSTIHESFEAQVIQSRLLPAIKDGDMEIDYDDLNARANQVAHFLKNEAKVAIEESVGIYMDNSIEAIVSILGILKAGCCYVPIDVKAPMERIKEIASQAQIRTIFTKRKHTACMTKLQWESLLFDRFIVMDDRASTDIVEKTTSTLMNEELWNQVAREAVDEITSSGWVTSDTGLPFSRSEMEEYKENVLVKVLPHVTKESKVLEIGCGSGLTLFSLAPHVGHYVGTDLSGEIIKRNRAIAENEKLNNISFFHMKAHEIDLLEKNSFDIVILNSVIHCFPTLSYFKNVLELAIDKVKDRGHIFLGDLMDQDLKENFIAYLKNFKEKNSTQGFRTKLDWSKELFVSRYLIEDLQVDFPVIVDHHSSLKLHNISNELTRFRFDVMLTIDKEHPVIVNPKRKHKHQHVKNDLDIQPLQNLNLTVDPDSLAYVLFTSGSTGQPKGVMVTHRTVINYIDWAIERYFKNSEEPPRFHFYSPLTFDLTVTSLFSPLFSGGYLRIHRGEFDEVLESIHNNQDCNIIKITPSHMRMMLETKRNVHNLRKFVVGGEALYTSLVQEFSNLYNDCLQIYNEYGPTEATVGCIEYEWNLLTENYYNQVPIGRPVRDVAIHILNDAGAPVPVGGIGEIYIGGGCLARGYLKRPDLTRERFLPDPFSNVKQSIMYKTGDLGRMLPNGQIEYLGRNDRQVKIRGYRIELNEIEIRLNQHPALSGSAVLVSEIGKETALCAYYLAKNEISALEIREWLANQLPNYMIPAYLVKLDSLPVSTHGKIDYAKLPDPIKEIRQNFTRPRSKSETIMTEIWCQVLDVNSDTFGVFDDFFDLGGDSIIAMRILSKAMLKGIKLNIKDIFLHRTIAALCENASRSSVENVKVQNNIITGTASLHPTQKWFFEKQLPHPEFFNMGYLFTIPEGTHLEKLELSLKKCLIHHDALRSIFIDIDGEIKQLFRPTDTIDFRLVEIDFSGLNYERQKTAITSACEDLQASIDHKKGPLFGAVIFNLGSYGKRLFIAVHHLVIDGVSWRYLVEDIEHLYFTDTNTILPSKSHSLIEFHDALNNFPYNNLDITYWQSIDLNKVDTLFTTTARLPSSECREITISFGKAFSKQIIATCTLLKGINVDQILITAFFYSLCSTFNAQALLVNHESHGRDPIQGVDPLRTIGWLTSIYPLVLQKQDSLVETLYFVRETLQRLSGINSHYGIGRFVYQDEKLQQLNPEILFNYFGRVGAGLLDGRKNLLSNCSESLGALTHKKNPNSHLVEINAIIMDDILNISILYDPFLRNASEMETWIENFKLAIHDLVETIKER